MLTEKEIEKAAKNTTSMRLAIDLQCKECIYDKYDKGTWRQQIEACTSYSCSLYNFRPVSVGGKNEK